MRTLKKTLALVLVVAMMMSLCISASAFNDDKEIKYTEAVEVLTAIGVIDGMPNGDFDPQGSLTRAQAAKILVYMLGMENVAKADGQIFDDVKESHWAADYIAYCAENGLVVGVGDNKYDPEGKLTGYQWAKMLLGALGVDTSAMIGAAWQIPVAKAAAEYGIFAGNAAADKTEIATREEACLYALNTLVSGVSYGYPVFDSTGKAVAYYDTVTEASLAAIALGRGYTIGATPVAYGNNNLLYTVHKVDFDYIRDSWGRPGYAYDGFGKNAAIYLDYWFAPVATYTTAVAECDIAAALDYDYNQEIAVPTFVNGVNNTNTVSINPVDTTTKIGGQGRLVEVYSTPVFGDEIVAVDTFLAKVDKVVAAKYDNAGHMKSPAYLYLTVYDRAGGIKVVESSYYGNYAYTAGDMLLVNMQTYQDAINASSYTVDLYTAPVGTGYGVANYLEVVGYADVTVGTQTIIWQNAAKHTVAGTTYMDATEFHLDEAQNNANKQYNWYFDSYGNLIGATEVKAVYSYGTIQNIQWINPVGSYGYAQATLIYMDGTTESVVIGSINGKAPQYTNWTGTYSTSTNSAVSANYAYNSDFIGVHLFQIAIDANGAAHLVEVPAVVTAATVTKGNPTVTGTNGPCYVDDSTQYLVRTTTLSGYAWNTVVGYNQITSLVNATVYYVNLDADIAAEYVYMYGQTATSATASLVYVQSLAYNYAVGTTDYITLKDAYVAGELTDVVVNSEWINGTGTELVAGTVYYMVDNNGDGKIYARDNTDTVAAIGTTPVDLGNGVYAKVIANTDYALLNNALQVTGATVPYNTINAVVYGGEFTGAENIVIVYKGAAISAIYVLPTAD